MAKDLTPKEFKCTNSFACPGVFELEDRRLLIVGEHISDWEALKFGVNYDPMANESAIVIERGLLDNVLCQANVAETGNGSSLRSSDERSAEVVVTAVIDDISAQMHHCFATGQDVRAEAWRLRLEGAARIAQKLGMLHPIEEEPSGDDTATAAGESASLTPNSTPQEAPAGPGEGEDD